MRVLLATIALALLAVPAGRGDDLPRLIGTVGPGFTIAMTDASGRLLDVVTEGRYELLVHDQSEIHNFVLGKKETGERPATTEVEFVGDQTFTVNLTRSHWVYACSPHFQTMNGAFVVVPAATTTPAPAAKPQALTAVLTASGTSLSAKRLKPGRYALTVVDRSKTRSFRLVGPGVNRRTGTAFVGKAVWQVSLRAGTYRFGTDLKLTGTLVVT